MSTPTENLAIELRLAEIITRYLSTPASQAKGIPDIVHRMDDGSEMTHPRLSVVCDDRGGGVKARLFLLRVTYHYSDEQDGGTKAAASSAVIHKVQSRLKDEDDLYAFISALSASERTGWKILDHSYPAAADTKRDDDADTALHAAIQFRLYVP